MHRSRPVQLSESSSLANEALQNRALDLRPPSSATTIPSRLTERQRAFFHSTCSGLSISAVIRSALALILLGSESMVDGSALDWVKRDSIPAVIWTLRLSQETEKWGSVTSTVPRSPSSAHRGRASRRPRLGRNGG